MGDIGWMNQVCFYWCIIIDIFKAGVGLMLFSTQAVLNVILTHVYGEIYVWSVGGTIDQYKNS